MSLTWIEVACPECAAQPGEQCWLDFPVTIRTCAEPHPERIEAVAFWESCRGPARDQQPLTAAEILATGEV